ncbi:MAG: hypothetical protein J7513_01595 [Solirubrobacteraceae bacterium]|nr:hypothetical protein [Solirubrobacteraceae bacterium]
MGDATTALTPPGVTVLGNLAIDRIDGAAPSPGGAPSFVAPALAHAGGGRIVARAASADNDFFAGIVDAAAGVPFDLVAGASTAAFSMRYAGDHRVMAVDAIGPSWEAATIRAACVSTAWVHLAALLRSDFTPGALAELAAAGTRIAFDGQGLVRAARTGPLVTDDAFDPALLAHVDLLKLADDEAAVLAGGAPFDLVDAARLGVPEIIVTAGSHGSTIYLAGEVISVAPPFRVEGVHATGAGDTFTVSYVAARASGESPAAAAELASQFVAELLLVRKDLG